MRIKMYSADWCSDCRVAKKYLDDQLVEYELIDITKDSNAAEYVMNVNGGKESYRLLLLTPKYILTPEFKNYQSL